MICPECKTKNTDNSVFCKKCGRKFQTGKGFSGRKICIIAGVALVVIAAVVAFMLFILPELRSGAGEVSERSAAPGGSAALDDKEDPAAEDITPRVPLDPGTVYYTVPAVQRSENTGSTGFHYINATDVNFRDKPELDSNVLQALGRGQRIHMLPLGDSWPTRFQRINEKIGNWIRGSVDGQEGWIFSPFVGYNTGTSGEMAFFSAAIYAKTNQTIEAPMLWVSDDGSMRNASETKDSDRLAAVREIQLLNRNGNRAARLTNIRRNTTSWHYPSFEGGNQLVADGELVNFPDIPWDSLSRLGISGAYNPQINFDQITVREDHKRAMLQAGTAYAIKNKSNYFWNEKGQLPNHEIFLPEDAEHHGLIDQKSGHTYIFSTLIHRRNPASQKDWSRTTSLFLAARISGTSPPRLVMAVPRAVGGDGRETEYFRGLTDLNGDGIPELWTSISGHEWWYYCAYELRNDGAVEIFRGGGGGL